MARKSYILKVDRVITIRGKRYATAYFAGIKDGSMIYKPKKEDAQVFNTKKDALYWFRFTGGEVVEL